MFLKYTLEVDLKPRVKKSIAIAYCKPKIYTWKSWKICFWILYMWENCKEDPDWVQSISTANCHFP